MSVIIGPIDGSTTRIAIGTTISKNAKPSFSHTLNFRTIKNIKPMGMLMQESNGTREPDNHVHGGAKARSKTDMIKPTNGPKKMMARMINKFRLFDNKFFIFTN